MNPENSIADRTSIRENKLVLVERLADDLAHEIKNPLHSMVINLEVLRRRISRIQAEPTEDLLRYTAILGAELDRVNRRVDLLLRMVRPNRESDDPATLAEVMEELRELVQLECERHEVHLSLEPPSDLVRATLPRAHTRQLILSLILQALDSAPAGGRLEIGAELDSDRMRIHFHPMGTPTDAAVEIVAQDDGPFLDVARTLAAQLGGEIEVLHTATPGPARLGDDSDRYVLSLPVRD